VAAAASVKIKELASHACIEDLPTVHIIDFMQAAFAATITQGLPFSAGHFLK
jgi:hypothetical protein